MASWKQGPVFEKKAEEILPKHSFAPDRVYDKYGKIIVADFH